MKFDIAYCDYYILQKKLDEILGENIVSVEFQDSNERKNLYIEYADDLDPVIVQNAKDICNQTAMDFFSQAKTEFIDRIERASFKTMQRCTIVPPSNQELKDAETWLADTSSPCPFSIVNLAILKDITQEQAAQFIIDNATAYQNYLNSAASIRSTGKSQLSAATEFFGLKAILNQTMNQLTELEQQN